MEFDNPGRWFPGASVDAELVVARHEKALSVPVLALSNRDGKTVVFTLDGDRVQAAVVATGWREDDWVEILGGIEPDQQVVVEGASMLTDGSQVTAKNMTASADAPKP